LAVAPRRPSGHVAGWSGRRLLGCHRAFPDSLSQHLADHNLSRGAGAAVYLDERREPVAHVLQLLRPVLLLHALQPGQVGGPPASRIDGLQVGSEAANIGAVVPPRFPRSVEGAAEDEVAAAKVDLLDRRETVASPAAGG